MKREYPDAPIAGVGAVIVRDRPDGQKQVLLIRRAQEPSKGEWSLPGGAVELGETLEQAICREVQEETGLIVETVDTPDQAVEAANRTLYGLTSSILSGNTYKAFELAPKILAGIVNVNSSTVNDEINEPMGGVRDSGWGRTGPDSLKEFSDIIWINFHSGPRQYPI